MITSLDNNIMEVNRDGTFCYPIVFEDSFNKLTHAWQKYKLTANKVCIITDSNVGPVYAQAVKEELEKICNVCIVYTFPAGEESKTLDTVQNLYEYLILHHFERKDMLVALGGGVVGDLTGFTAATYLRGIPFVQIPTSLLAQVDSSIGGKTGVDFSQYKNMVGAFYMPRLVYMNLGVLSTLPENQFYAGMGEVIKSALIKDNSLYEWLNNHLYEIRRKDPRMIFCMVYNCCNIKRLVVEKDPTEKGERALLNLGHTIGHAIEKAMDFKLLHGECVSLGIVAAAYISVQRKLLSEKEYEAIKKLLSEYDLPVAVSGIEPEEIVRLSKNDKKMEEGKIKFILLDGIGSASIDNTVTDDELIEGIRVLCI